MMIGYNWGEDSMYNIVIWGCGGTYNKYINCIKLQEVLGEISIIGITGKDKLYLCLDGYRYISPCDLKRSNADFVIIASDLYFNEIFKEAMSLGFTEDNIIQAKAFAYPGFIFSDYVELLRSHVSIIANNCWGGIVYNKLGLQFRSPFINMFENEKDYIELLSNLKQNLVCKLELKNYQYNSILQREYPVCLLGEEIELHFNHYISMKEVESKWYKRVERINYDNLFIMMYTENEATAQIFDTLDYTNKICFVPFECGLKSSCTIHLANNGSLKKLDFWQVINKTADGSLKEYDMIKLLRTGQVNRDGIIIHNNR